jgi:hypothetical protein
VESILEIKDSCATPEQLLRSYAFARYLKIYKKEYLDDLEKKGEKHSQEAKQKIDVIANLSLKDILKVFDREAKGKELERDRAIVRFLDGCYHHYRNKGFSRLVRLNNNIVTTGTETQKSFKSKVSEKAENLSELIIITRRKLLDRVGLGHGVSRSSASDASPNVTAGEISGHYANYPSDYSILAHTNLTVTADIKTGVHYETSVNKRAFPFYELEENPLNLDNFNPEEWVAVPLSVGKWLIIAYIHKSRGCIEMEPGLLNLFPFYKVNKDFLNKKPDGLFFFGYPKTKKEELGFYRDKKNDLLIGMVPAFPEYGYFGYCKKPILTLHNVLAITKGDFPLHCGCNRYVVGFDKESNEPFISEIFIKADDMGKAEFYKSDKDTIKKLKFYGTEIGAFACLDGFSENAKLQLIGREIGYNASAGTNARQIVPVAEENEVSTGSDLDLLLYINNYDLKKPGEKMVDTSMSVKDAIVHFHDGRRCAAGSTQTGRGGTEISYWANPFPLLKDNNGKILHKELYEKYTETEEELISSIEKLVSRGDMEIGIAYSMLMAGVYEGNTDEMVIECGFKNREEIEQEGPIRLAESLIKSIKEFAIKKRERIGNNVQQVDVTVAMIGDSRTGKSETSEKMEGILNMNIA